MFKKQLVLILCLAAVCFLFSHQNKWQTKLAHKIKHQEIPLWMLEQVAEDLKPFADGISNESLDGLVQDCLPDNNFGFARFQIKEGKLSIKYGHKVEKERRFRTIKRSLETLCKTTQMPDLDFVVTIQDASPYPNPQQIPGPLFAFAKNRLTEKQVILIPDDGALRGNKSWLTKVEKGIKKSPWKSKENKVFWRGSTTGACATIDTFNAMPRAKLVALSLQAPEAVDARFNHLVQMNEETVQKLTDLGYKGETVSVIDHLKYKYQILIDGNTCAYTRAFWQLFSNCAIFKQASDNIQWFYRALAPNVHYIPIENNMSDLLEKVEWAKFHDKEVHRIVRNANLFAENNLKIEDVHLYLYLLLTEYSKLQK